MNANKRLTMTGDSMTDFDLWPIVPDAGLYLFAVNQNPARFAKAFSDTWNRINKTDRERLQTQWQAARMPWAMDPFPVIHVVCHYPVYGRGEDEAFASCDEGGCRFTFDSWFVDRLSERALRQMIAHELAHSLLKHSNQPDKSERDVELEANVQVLVWGFGLQAIGTEGSRLLARRQMLDGNDDKATMTGGRT